MTKGRVAGSGRLVTQGEIGCKRLKIELDPNSIVWPDYVFEDQYKLMPLSELLEFVKLNKHLPGVPKSEDVMYVGIDVAEMNVILLKKVEELTLHLIQLQQQINQLKEQN